MLTLAHLVKKKMLLKAGPEYGQHQGKFMITKGPVWELTGLSWMTIFLQFMEESLGFIPT